MPPADHAASPLASILHEACAPLVSGSHMDIVVLDESDEFEIQTDTWTLYLRGWPLAEAWMALDDDAVSAAEQQAVLTNALNGRELGILRAIDAALTGALVDTLAASPDGLSNMLAAIIRDDA